MRLLAGGSSPQVMVHGNYSARHRLPYVALEDGFLRSLGLGVEGYQPHSMVVRLHGHLSMTPLDLVIRKLA